MHPAIGVERPKAMVVIDGYIGIVAPGRLRMKGYVIVVAALFAGA